MTQIIIIDFLWWGYETVFYMMEQFDSMGGTSIFFNMMEPLNGKRLNKARERHMHWKLKYRTLLMVPQAKLSYGCAR